VHQRESGEANAQDCEHEDAEPILGEIMHRAAGVCVLASIPEDERERQNRQQEVEDSSRDEADEAGGVATLAHAIGIDGRATVEGGVHTPNVPNTPAG
jgi:hypothetical protein